MASEFTTQLFFDQTLIDSITTSVCLYSLRGLPDTNNAEDNIYNSATQSTLLTAGPTAAYMAALTISLQTG